MLIERIKADQLDARKAKDTVTAKILTGIISDSTEVGVNSSTPSDEKVIAVIRKYLKGINETLDLISGNAGNAIAFATCHVEKAALETYLPKSFTDEEVSVILLGMPMNNIGAMMGKVKKAASEQDKLFDGAQVQRVIKNFHK